MINYYLFIYFLAGVIQDFLLTLNYRYISQNKIVGATITSFIVTIVSLIVLYDIITRLDSQRSIVAIVFYAAGIATGTFLAMKVKKGFKN